MFYSGAAVGIPNCARISGDAPPKRLANYPLSSLASYSIEGVGGGGGGGPCPVAY
jgi:hypothetical protein